MFRITPLRTASQVERAVRVNRRLVAAFGGDPDTVSLTQVYRVPNTLQFDGTARRHVCRLLTDDSGVGLDHAEPTIPCYRVTLLRDLMVRILQSELGGRRIEAGQVLREVGSYAGGVCRS